MSEPAIRPGKKPTSTAFVGNASHWGDGSRFGFEGAPEFEPIAAPVGECVAALVAVVSLAAVALAVPDALDAVAVGLLTVQMPFVQMYPGGQQVLVPQVASCTLKLVACIGLSGWAVAL